MTEQELDTVTVNGSIVVVVYNKPGDEGATYTLRLPDGTEAIIGDAQDEYGVLANIIDDAVYENVGARPVLSTLGGQVPVAEHLYEKCRDCHLFVERNEDAELQGCAYSGTTLHEWGEVITGPGLLPHQACVFCKQVRAEFYEHLHRGDDVDERLDESHQAMPSGRRANLLTWKTYGPLAMRERFTS